MGKNNFFKTKEGGLTLAFIIIMIAFAIVMMGLNMASDVVCAIGFVLIVVAMLYSPIKVYVFDRRKK